VKIAVLNWINGEEIDRIMDTQERTRKLITQNRHLRHDYEIMQTIEAGIMLQGTEVKSLRQGRCSLIDAYAHFPNDKNNELFLVNFHINTYEQGNINNHVPKRPRKLLVNYREAVKLRTAVQEKGLTLLPYSLYFSGPYVKVELCVCRAKKKYDKRESEKERESKRDINRDYKFK